MCFVIRVRLLSISDYNHNTAMRWLCSASEWKIDPEVGSRSSVGSLQVRSKFAWRVGISSAAGISYREGALELNPNRSLDSLQIM